MIKKSVKEEVEKEMSLEFTKRAEKMKKQIEEEV